MSETNGNNNGHKHRADKRELFKVEYLKDRNATQAAIRAGYSNIGIVPLTGFYVYALLDDKGDIFYIGKGTRNRVLHHEQDVRAMRIGNVAKFNKINSILAGGSKKIEFVILDRDDSESYILDCERYFIASFKNCNLTNVSHGACKNSQQLASESASLLLDRMIPLDKWIALLSKQEIQVITKVYGCSLPEVHQWFSSGLSSLVARCA